jgi:hypothetical protein
MDSVKVEPDSGRNSVTESPFRGKEFMEIKREDDLAVPVFCSVKSEVEVSSYLLQFFLH